MQTKAFGIVTVLAVLALVGGGAYFGLFGATRAADPVEPVDSDRGALAPPSQPSEADAELEAPLRGESTASRVVPESGHTGGLLPASAGVSEESGETAAAGAEPIELRLVARAVDGSGHPLAGARLLSAKPKASATSAADGRIELVLELLSSDLAGYLPLDLRMEGHVPLELKPSLEGRGDAFRSDPRIDLGDLVLLRAGSVRGRVVDALGHGVEGARVVATHMGPLGWGARGSGPSDGLSEATSEANGAFHLPSLPPGELRVWAGGEETWWSFADGVRVEAGRETSDVELRIEALEPEDVIALSVVDPDHEPVPRARIAYYYHESGTSSSGSVVADENGHYRRVLERRGAFDFSAQDPDHHYRPAVARGVAPGTHDLVLVLGAPRVLRVLVSDLAGEPVPGFSVRCRSVADERWLQGAAHSATEAGQEGIDFQLPTEAFELTASAEGYRTEVLGPLSPEEVGGEVRLRLAPLPGVRGRVLLSSGAPAVGYDVGLHGAITGEASLTVNGFRSRSSRGESESTETDAEGRFTLSLQESGSYYLRASSSSSPDAPGDLGPLELDAGVGRRGLVIQLEEPGAIEGRLLLPPGRDPAGLVVGVSRADGFAVTGRTDTKGRFRFAGLTPGPWFVKRCSEEIRSGWTSSTSSDSGGDLELPWSCDVWAGRTTHFDLDLTESGRVVVTGSFLVDGNVREGWSASLHTRDDGEQQLASDRLDSQGAFRIETGEPGAFRLRLSGFDGTGFLRLTQDIDLELGENGWTKELSMGRVEGRVALQAADTDNGVSVFVTDADGGQSWCVASLDGDGRFAVDVPAGQARVSFASAPAKEVEVRPGGTARVELP